MYIIGLYFDYTKENKKILILIIKFIELIDENILC